MKTLTKNCVNWVKEYFANLGQTKAVVGISGGRIRLWWLRFV